MALDLVGVLSQEGVLVLSAIVLVFWIFYSLIIYRQLQSGTARKDWWISMLFYVGIAMLVLANMLLAASALSGTELGTEISAVVEMVSMAVFIYGFYIRMKTAITPEPSGPGDFPGIKIGAKQDKPA
jgi:hypothetical protein